MVNSPDETCDERGRDEPGANPLERRARELFDDSVERLDGHTRSRLNQARQAALAEWQRSTRSWSLTASLGGLTAVVLVAVVMLMWPGARTPNRGAVPLDDLEIVAEGDNLELLQDVEFYAWLDQR
jgi:hypothetical protein